MQNPPPLILPGEKIEHIIMFASKEEIEKVVKELDALGYKEDTEND